MRFSGFLGNEDIKRLLADAYGSGRFPHAIVLQGEKGTGKRTFAKLLAKALVCREKKDVPCEVCPSCVRAAAGSHPDIRTEEGSGATRSLTVDTVKRMTADAYRMPEEADVSVYLLFIENRFPEAAQNKLLKLIEEPPANTVFIITCKDAGMLLPTIRSRVQVFTLRAPDTEEAAAYVSREKKMDRQEALRLSKACGGNIGRMLEESTDEAETAQNIAADIAKRMTASGEHGLLAATAPLIKDRKLFGETLARLHLIFRDACILRAGGTGMLSGARDEAEELGRFTLKKLSALPDLTRRYQLKAEQNANMTLLVTAFCAELKQVVTE